MNTIRSCIILTVDLRISGKTCFNFQTIIEFWKLFLILKHDTFTFRTRTYQRHISLKYIEKLRKLIQMKISQHMTYRCDTGIMLGCQSCTVFLRIYAHTAEFTDLKGLSTQCQTVLKIKHRTSVVCFYRNRYDQHDR